MLFKAKLVLITVINANILVLLRLRIQNHTESLRKHQIHSTLPKVKKYVINTFH